MTISDSAKEREDAGAGDDSSTPIWRNYVRNIRRTWGPLSGVVLPLLSLAILTFVWKFVQVAWDMPHYLLPPPEDVASISIERRELFLDHSMVTLREVLWGFGAAVVIAIPLAILMASWRTLELMLYPPLVASQGIPKSALAPIFVIWLGFGIMPKIVIAMLIAFFPIVVATFVGLKSIQPEMIDLSRSMGMSWFAVLRKVTFPNALPNVFGGLKVGITLAVVGSIVAEFVAAEEGLGYLILNATSQLRTDVVFGAIIYVAAMGIILFTIIDRLEKLTTPWYTERQLQTGA